MATKHPATSIPADWVQPMTAAAEQAALNSYSPYSHFRVGAALLAEKDGHKQLFIGTNVENSSYGLTICAERSAACAAVVAGFTHFVALALFTDTAKPCHPCGACCQVLAEFNDKLPLLLVARDDKRQELALNELFTTAFQLNDYRNP